MDSEKHNIYKPMPEAVVIENFLHLAPNYILRFRFFEDDYHLDRIWPEVVFTMDLETAIQLKKRLEVAWARLKVGGDPFEKAANDAPPVKSMGIYRIDKYSDEAFYRMVHRVPTSLINLRKFEQETGIAIAKLVTGV